VQDGSNRFDKFANTALRRKPINLRPRTKGAAKYARRSRPRNYRHPEGRTLCLILAPSGRSGGYRLETVLQPRPTVLGPPLTVRPTMQPQPAYRIPFVSPLRSCAECRWLAILDWSLLRDVGHSRPFGQQTGVPHACVRWLAMCRDNI
jgi:hypothetical protein